MWLTVGWGGRRDVHSTIVECEQCVSSVRVRRAAGKFICVVVKAVEKVGNAAVLEVVPLLVHIREGFVVAVVTFAVEQNVTDTSK